MGFNCGIVGLPNVGKSTLFNALTQTAAAEAANYPFCTIEPNVGCVGVPDARLEKLASIAKSKKIIPTQVEFVDIAGLVRGASKGEGLGNQFLGHIRSTDAVIHILRCFEDEDITHVDGKVDPLKDLETVETELMLADIDSLEKRLAKLNKKPHMSSGESKDIQDLMQAALALLSNGESLVPKKGEGSRFRELELISDKPVLYVCNVSESGANKHSDAVMKYAKAHGFESTIVSCSIEAELASLPPNEQVEFLQSMGMSETGLAKVIRAGYKLLNLSTFFTAGPEETRAWSIKTDSLAPDAAAEIHTDFKRGFICAAVISYEDYVAYNGEAGAKAAGKMRLEGKEYVVQDGDVVHFRFNV
ncbi:MAG: redox-regulated ATPase YchF [Holosporales bacterium]|jgi:GTP-binding protein YchF|nr:redox-regulated ATPase YchF [Holosporales bacterium]